MALEDICIIIDLDGFQFGETFHTREFGYSSITQNITDSYRFDLTPLVKTMTPKNWSTVQYCKYNVHGLTLRPLPGEKDLYPEKYLHDLIRLNYDRHRTFDRSYIGFKGGNIERKILEKLRIPCINIENFGCPKYNDLPKPKIKDCGYHINNDKIDQFHCPKQEAFAFVEWVKKNSFHP